MDLVFFVDRTVLPEELAPMKQLVSYVRRIAPVQKCPVLVAFSLI